ncbi:hypothetical protein QQF09_07790 [Clostridium perfringens]|uniref:hypothetical protein n=1 Tax=Clostridium perfringens TaxID=1502 RepID=UPI00374A3AD5
MIKKLFLDLNNFKANLGSVERGDSIELNIKLLDGEDYSRSKFRVLGAKADGKYVEQIEGINLEEKDLKIVLEDQFVNCEGIVKLELNVVSSETEITTKEFYFFVSNTMNAEIIDSVDSIKTLEKVSKYVDDAVNNLDALKEASEDITIINSEFKENEIKRKANEMLREKNEKARLQSEDIRITEEEEREANELERIKAENNRKASENNRKVSENTRVTNERAREEAELSRQSTFEENEEIRNSNENLRIESEKERIKFNNKAKTDEVNRKEAETKRVEAEKTRVIAEDERKKAETSRQEAEDIRQNTYTNFNEAEEERRNNEISRQEAEVLRIEAEKRRDDLYSQKEEERNAAFLESERTRGTAFNEAQNDRNLTFEESEAIREEAFKVSEAARDEAEEGRVEAESERVKSEKARVLADEERNTTFTQKEEERNNTFTQNETNRNTTFTQSEEERKTTFEEAENARKVAESKRVKAESSRVEAEKLRVAAETERVEAENLRATAEEERAAAETKREEGFNKFDGKINANTKELKAARSATTGEKFNTLDERIDHEVDRLNKKIDVTMLQQEDKESHTIENSVNGMTTDMVVKGRTLFNHVGKYLKHAGCDWDDNKVTVSGISLNDGYSINFEGTAIDINKSYILGIYIESLNDNAKNLGFSMGVLDNTGSAWNKVESITPVKGWNFVELAFDKSKTLGNIRFRNSKPPTDLELNIVFTNFIMIEKINKYSFIDNPCYFKDFKSFGQQEDKISILSHGKNLFDYNKLTSGEIVSFNDRKCYKFTDNSTNFTLDVKGEENKQYTISIKMYREPSQIEKRLNVQFVYSDGTFKTYNLDHNVLREFTTESGKTLVKIKGAYNHSLNAYIDLECTQLEEGTIKTTYEPYKQDKKDILLQNLGFDEGLRGLNLTVYDELNNIRNVAIKRVDKYKLTGEEEIYTEETIAENNMKFVITTRGTSVKPSGSVISDNFIKGNDTVSNSVRLATNNKVIINIDKTKLSEHSVEGFKTWLKANPTTIYYELAEPIETPLDENIALKAFNEKTYVSFENAISGTSSFKAPVNTVATISRLNRENRALEEENKTLRQDFESTTLSLTDSDLELVKQNVDIDFRLMEVEFALDIPQSTLSSNINFKNKKGEVKSMARTPYAMMKIVILSGDYDREDYIHKVGKYYERGRMTKDEHDELISLMTADEVISK